MTLTLTQSDWDELWESPAETQAHQTAIDNFDALCQLPLSLGSGYSCSLELGSGIWLSLSDWTSQEDWAVKRPIHDHLIQILVLLSGTTECPDVYPTFNKNRAYFSGSGLSPSYTDCYYQGQRLVSVNVELEPALLEPMFAEDEPSQEALRSLLCKDQDWKASFYPTVTVAMRSLAQQIWNPPYCGAARRMYLQAKIWELLAMQIDLVMADRMDAMVVPKLRPDTIARLYYAKEILTNQLEYPPMLSELSQQAGVSDRTLRRGFQELFGISPLRYLTQQRMKWAKCLLQDKKWTVAEVARTVGYGHLGHFAAAFKQEFGVNPSMYLKGKKSDLGS